ncbi:MAG: carbohydrate-binding protein [Dysgonamonadaceae bacterium]|jgi:hypothetical protein|nr:carbohydrate-binding protein [Dysgonamonadaceae bacterium]
MKRYAIFIIIGLFTVVCSYSQTKSFKRGLGYNTLMTEDVAALSPGVSWGYNWGHIGSGNESAFKTYAFEFVPMAWSGLDKESVRNYLSSHPEVKYILGFNEPNFKNQSNLTPAEAAGKWADIEEIADEFGLTTVGPAVNYSPDAPYQNPLKWYDEFFAACAACRVDHIAIHLYMPSMSAIKSNIEQFKKYNRPIWLTEFCAWENNTTLAAQKQFMIETLDYLETDPDVFRYAWFKERGWNDGHPYMQLLDPRTEGVLKDLGEVFVHMSSYDDDYYFTVDQVIPSEHYVRMKGVSMEKTSDESGHINLCEFDVGEWVDYNVNIPETGEYNVSFRIAAEYPDESKVKLSINNTEFASLTFEKKGIGVWDTQSLKTTFQQGKQTIRMGFKQGGLKLNWWLISKAEQLSVANIAVESQTVKSCEYYDLTGKRVTEKYKGFVIQKTICNNGSVTNAKYFRK